MPLCCSPEQQSQGGARVQGQLVSPGLSRAAALQQGRPGPECGGCFPFPTPNTGGGA